MITETDTWHEAHDICADRTSTAVSILIEKSQDIEDQATGKWKVYYNILPNYPVHLASTWVSLMGMLVWLFASPHTMVVAKVLDQKRACPPHPLPFSPTAHKCAHAFTGRAFTFHTHPTRLPVSRQKMQ
jgi:hypothetical protein